MLVEIIRLLTNITSLARDSEKITKDELGKGVGVGVKIIRKYCVAPCLKPAKEYIYPIFQTITTENLSPPTLNPIHLAPCTTLVGNSNAGTNTNHTYSRRAFLHAWHKYVLESWESENKKIKH